MQFILILVRISFFFTLISEELFLFLQLCSFVTHVLLLLFKFATIIVNLPFFVCKTNVLHFESYQNAVYESNSLRAENHLYFMYERLQYHISMQFHLANAQLCAYCNFNQGFLACVLNLACLRNLWLSYLQHINVVCLTLLNGCDGSFVWLEVTGKLMGSRFEFIMTLLHSN